MLVLLTSLCLHAILNTCKIFTTCWHSFIHQCISTETGFVSVMGRWSESLRSADLPVSSTEMKLSMSLYNAYSWNVLATFFTCLNLPPQYFTKIKHTHANLIWMQNPYVLTLVGKGSSYHLFMTRYSSTAFAMITYPHAYVPRYLKMFPFQLSLNECHQEFKNNDSINLNKTEFKKGSSGRSFQSKLTFVSISQSAHKYSFCKITEMADMNRLRHIL